MILLVAILAGLAAGLFLALIQKRSWTVPPLKQAWLVVVAFIPQFINSYLPATRGRLSNDWAAAGLIFSQILLLVFCWFNRQVPGVWLLALGLVCNMVVIALNGGFMPISPQTAGRLAAPDILARIPIGERFGYKDILLLPDQTRLAWLSDILLPPRGFPYQVAFSPGDVCIAAGAFWCLASQGKTPDTNRSERLKGT